MSNTLAYPRRTVRFITLVGVTDVSLTGTTITGRWKVYPHWDGLTKWPHLLADFANWPDQDTAILQFTKEYGPLGTPARARGAFEFSVDDWRAMQREFRHTWDSLHTPMGQPVPVVPPISDVEAAAGERFSVVFGQISYQTSTLYQLLRLELAFVDPNHVRRCARSDCQNPYMINARYQQTYCSDACANWAQKQVKKEWWREHGSEERRRRMARRKKGGKA